IADKCHRWNPLLHIDQWLTAMYSLTRTADNRLNDAIIVSIDWQLHFHGFNNGHRVAFFHNLPGFYKNLPDIASHRGIERNILVVISIILQHFYFYRCIKLVFPAFHLGTKSSVLLCFKSSNTVLFCNKEILIRYKVKLAFLNFDFCQTVGEISTELIQFGLSDLVIFNLVKKA